MDVSAHFLLIVDTVIEFILAKTVELIVLCEYNDTVIIFTLDHS